MGWVGGRWGCGGGGGAVGVGSGWEGVWGGVHEWHTLPTAYYSIRCDITPLLQQKYLLSANSCKQNYKTTTADEIVVSRRTGTSCRGVRHYSLSDPNAWWRHQMEKFSALLALHEGNLQVYSPHKGQRRGALVFSLVCAWTNGWANSRGAGDLRRHRAHYDVNVMEFCVEPCKCTDGVSMVTHHVFSGFPSVEISYHGNWSGSPNVNSDETPLTDNIPGLIFMMLFGFLAVIKLW